MAMASIIKSWVKLIQSPLFSFSSVLFGRIGIVASTSGSFLIDSSCLLAFLSPNGRIVFNDPFAFAWPVVFSKGFLCQYIINLWLWGNWSIFKFRRLRFLWYILIYICFTIVILLFLGGIWITWLRWRWRRFCNKNYWGFPPFLSLDTLHGIWFSLEKKKK